jgi:tetratricopeptide (TPR) repeat protein
MLDPLINFLKEKDELIAARELLAVMGRYATQLEEYDTLGRLFHDVKDYQSALYWAERALMVTADPQVQYSCRANIAKLHNHMNNPDKALTYLNLNEQLTPDSPEVKLEKVFSLFLLNRKTEAEEILRQMADESYLYSEDINNRVSFNLGTYDLYKGKLLEGLRGFVLVGKELDITKKRTMPFPQWEGQPVGPGQKVIIMAEAGIGDEIINFRFCKKMKELGIDPIWLTAGRSDLATIFTKNGSRAYSNIGALLDREGDDVMWCYSMALPIYLNTKIEELWDGPYLQPDPTFVQKHSGLFNKDKLKVGIRWNGNPFYDHDLHRGIPLDRLVASLKNPNIQLYSVQRDSNANEVLDYPEVIDLQHELKTYEDTLAILSQLDVLVTSCTSVAHAAAAMGVRVWVIVPISAYYTWCLTSDQTTPWYGDNIRVLRQVNNKNWEQPLHELDGLVKKIIGDS